MRKIIILLLVVSVSSFAGISVGISTGLNIPILNNDCDVLIDDKCWMSSTIPASVLVDVPIKEKFVVESGLTFSHRRMYLSGGLEIGNFEASFLELPITARYNFSLGSTTFYTSGGMFLGLGLGGTYHHGPENDTEAEDIEFGSGGHLQRVDLGMAFRAGFEFKFPIFIGMGYKHGLVNLSESSGMIYKSSAFTVFEIGYMFGKK